MFPTSRQENAINPLNLGITGETPVELLILRPVSFLFAKVLSLKANSNEVGRSNWLRDVIVIDDQSIYDFVSVSIVEYPWG